MLSNILIKVFAGVIIPNTPLINSVITFAKDYLNEMGFNYLIR